jgi:competence protein ComGC
MKAFTLVSFLLQTAIIVFGISIMLTVVLPAVEKVRVSTSFNINSSIRKFTSNSL